MFKGIFMIIGAVALSSLAMSNQGWAAYEDTDSSSCIMGRLGGGPLPAPGMARIWHRDDGVCEVLRRDEIRAAPGPDNAHHVYIDPQTGLPEPDHCEGKIVFGQTSCTRANDQDEEARQRRQMQIQQGLERLLQKLGQ